MQKFEKGFFVGAATAAHQVEGNNIHSDYWAQEQLPHTSFAEPSGIACDHYNRYEEDIRLLADAGLVETATFGKEEVQRVPGGRQVGIISDGERL